VQALTFLLGWKAIYASPFNRKRSALFALLEFVLTHIIRSSPQSSKSRVTFVLDQPSVTLHPPSTPSERPRKLTGRDFVEQPIEQPPASHQRKDAKFSSPTDRVITSPESVASFHNEVTYPLDSKWCTRWMFDGTSLSKLQPTRDKLFIDTSHPGTSLADLLLASRPFTLRERRILAVILAHSMLNFCDTPWVGKNWDKNHLSFFKRKSKKGSQLDFHRPWISTQFDNTTATEDVDELYRIHKNPSVLALGILLLEIELRAGIEESATEDDLSPTGEVDCNTSLFTAERLLETQIDDMFERYRNAIEACLKCDFVEDGASTSLDDEDFQQAVYENIVVPLEEELWIGFGLKPQDLGLEKC
jgi:hypothetical protein